jgi:hypothetical protein
VKLHIFSSRTPKLEPPKPPFLIPEVPHERRSPSLRNMLVLGNCQARPIAACLRAMNGEVAFTALELPLHLVSGLFAEKARLYQALSQYDRILLQAYLVAPVIGHFPDLATKVQRFPIVDFSAFHPDLVYVGVRGQAQHLSGPLSHYHSAIALWAYLRELTPVDTVSLFCERTYEALGYFNYWEASRQSLLDESAATGVVLGEALDRWQRAGCFMHSINHPKLHVCADVAAKLLVLLELPSHPVAASFLRDEFTDGAAWPVYPEIGQRLGIEGSYFFKIETGLCPPERPVIGLGLREFVEGSFEAFGKHPRADLRCERLRSGVFQELDRLLISAASSPARPSLPLPDGTTRRTPYSGLPPHQFWKSAVASVASQAVDPVVQTRFRIARDTKIATAGSCFAQNISAALRRVGFNYFVTESGAGMPPEEAQRRMFSTYSARYGNVYTARQLLQLCQRAFGLFRTVDTAWQRADGKYVDAFRPLVDPSGYDTAQIVELQMLWHLSKVRELLEKMDVMIFTLGLTEAWRSKLDGAVFPLAPGVAGGIVDYSRYEFVNFRMLEVAEDLEQFLALLREINPRARLIFTVSPVPLLATYEPKHALVATTYSKSVLRAAIDEVCSRHEHCDYFPSYEIVTGNYSRGRYFEGDLRSVTPEGVRHVMRLFLKHYAGESVTEFVDPELLKEFAEVREIFCDEQAIVS